MLQKKCKINLTWCYLINHFAGQSVKPDGRQDKTPSAAKSLEMVLVLDVTYRENVVIVEVTVVASMFL